VPDAKTVWLYREALAKTGLIEVLFADFDSHLKKNGYLAMGGQIIDATIIPVPKNRNSREENEAIKAGEMPKDWENNPAKLRQKDRDARWTKKHGRSHYGYKNHISIDRRHKLVRRYTVTNAARHDSQEFDTVLDDTNTCRDVWADSAYRSAESISGAACTGGRNETTACPSGSTKAIRPVRKSAPGWSMCSVIRSPRWVANWCAPLASSARKSKSGCKTSPIICNASLALNE
jgi:hypothetical protein